MFQKEDIIEIINLVSKPYGFKQSGNNWKYEYNEITKIINLQKSLYSKQYYVNYGYIINKLKLDDMKMHVFNGLGNIDEIENKKIIESLNLENNINDEKRKIDLEEILKDLLNKMNLINSVEDIKKELLSRQTLNDIPTIVKDQLGIRK